jgi:hypothetical protein
VPDDQINEIVIYPNPAKEFMHIKNLRSKQEYEIYDISGRKIVTGVIADDNNRIDISNMASGVYFLQLNRIHTIKFVVE